jgi:hypothetical protein
MRTTKLLMCVCCLIAATTAWGQSADSRAKQGILGFLDPQTGAFHPVQPAVVDEAELPAATVFTGTITVTITITVKTTALTTFSCTAQVSTTDNVGTASPVIYGETDTVSATGTGSTRTCKLSIPYAWSLATQSTDNMSTSYFVNGTGGTTSLTTRSSSRTPLDVRKVPANGSITALTAAVTQ